MAAHLGDGLRQAGGERVLVARARQRRYMTTTHFLWHNADSDRNNNAWRDDSLLLLFELLQLHLKLLLLLLLSHQLLLVLSRVH